jgi:4-carboxymuconolactone decarboxylase
MSRRAPLDLANLTDAQRRVVAEVRAGRRGTVPANVVAWLPSPELARRAAALGEFVRYETSLGPRLSELAILVVARHWSCAYEWAVHAREASAAGVPAEVIEAIGAGGVPAFDDPRERAVHAFAAALVATSRVSDTIYEDAVTALAPQGVVELVAIVGYYTMVAMTLNGFEVPPPAGAPILSDVDGPRASRRV